MIRIGVFSGSGRLSKLEPVIIKGTASTLDSLNTNRLAIPENKPATNKRDEQSS
ncbi:hypothetical protein [Paenibacillus lactis]|uniref:hypothetical protein n=1 Tax=Paenibacillus lactis TaxID=228574 RepID=UPI003D705557